MVHPDFTKLFELAAGLVTKAPRHEIEAHVEKCKRCGGEAATARRLVETIRADRLREPPRALVQRAIFLWQKEHPRRSRRAIEVLKAALTFDSFDSPLPAAVRAPASSGISARPRRLLYSAEDYDIDIAVERAASPRGLSRLRGQVLSRVRDAAPPGGSKAMIRRARGRTAVVPIDAHSRFDSGPLASGRYRVTFRCGSVEIVVDRLDVN